MDDRISPTALRAEQETGTAPTVLDVRDAADYAAGHVPGAWHIPAADLAGRLGEIPRGRPVVTYCTLRHPGAARSERAAAVLREHGFHARVLDGGLPAWHAAGLPVDAQG